MRHSWVYKIEGNEALILDAMVRELVGCLDDGMDHSTEVEVVLDLAAERRGVVVEEDRGHGDAKGGGGCDWGGGWVTGFE